MAGFANYDELVSEMTAGKHRVCHYYKSSTTMVAAQWYHIWSVTGIPGAGALYTGTDLTFQRTGETTVGAIYHGGNKSPETKHVVSIMNQNANVNSGIFMLVDMVGYYPMANQSASPQTFINTNAPDRYNGAGESGLQICLVNGAATGATASNLTSLNYVNQAGGAGAVITTPAIPVTVSAALPSTILGSRCLTSGFGPFLPLATGDTGVRSLTDVTFSAANTGLHAFLLVKPLCVMPDITTGVPMERDYVMQTSILERVRDGACLTILEFVSATTAHLLMTNIDIAWS